MLNRRRFMITAGVGTGLALYPGIAFASAATNRRFVFLLLRGGADGLALVAPTGDPGFARDRGPFVQQALSGHRLDSMFTLHPAMPKLAAMYDAGQLICCHATASAYRDRSHFDGQNVLESGGRLPGERNSGWLNRLIGLLPESDRVGLAIGSALPLALRGIHGVGTYVQDGLRSPEESTLERVSALYQDTPLLASVWQNALDIRQRVGSERVTGDRAAMTGALIGKLMTGANGARIAMAELDGWDTHAQQAGALNGRLAMLDTMIGAIRTTLGGAWQQTVVVVASEFGRTVEVNGTQGTDHGTGGVAFLVGGAVKGGRVLADWPGLAISQLYEGRDLRPTQSLEAILAGCAAEHFALDPELTKRSLFAHLGSNLLPSGLLV